MPREFWILVGAICLLLPSWAIARRLATTHERAAVVRGVAGRGYPPKCAVVYISTVNRVGAGGKLTPLCRLKMHPL